mmetsp:Transcript_12633/g.31505  ORF Transcript_12633/g.31505 Transcript_12633/m.31505 type:complete len:426 (+) Transcript_12633:1763-3040(+)
MILELGGHEAQPKRNRYLSLPGENKQQRRRRRGEPAPREDECWGRRARGGDDRREERLATGEHADRDVRGGAPRRRVVVAEGEATKGGAEGHAPHEAVAAAAELRHVRRQLVDIRSEAGRRGGAEREGERAERRRVGALSGGRARGGGRGDVGGAPRHAERRGKVREDGLRGSVGRRRHPPRRIAIGVCGELQREGERRLAEDGQRVDRSDKRVDGEHRLHAGGLGGRRPSAAEREAAKHQRLPVRPFEVPLEGALHLRHEARAKRLPPLRLHGEEAGRQPCAAEPQVAREHEGMRVEGEVDAPLRIARRLCACLRRIVKPRVPIVHRAECRGRRVQLPLGRLLRDVHPCVWRQHASRRHRRKERWCGDVVVLIGKAQQGFGKGEQRWQVAGSELEGEVARSIHCVGQHDPLLPKRRLCRGGKRS